MEIELEDIGRLELVERVADERASVAGGDSDGVLDLDALKHLVAGVAEHALGGADEPLDEVGGVRERILNRAAALGAVAVVDFAICRTKRGEVLPGDNRGMADRAEVAGEEKVAGLLHCGLKAVHVGDAGEAAGAGVGAQQRGSVGEVERERLLNQDVVATLQRADRDR